MVLCIVESICGSEECYWLLFDSVGDVIVMVDCGSGCIFDVNCIVVVWMGCSECELVGKDFFLLFVYDLLDVDNMFFLFGYC